MSCDFEVTEVPMKLLYKDDLVRISITVGSHTICFDITTQVASGLSILLSNHKVAGSIHVRFLSQQGQSFDVSWLSKDCVNIRMGTDFIIDKLMAYNLSLSITSFLKKSATEKTEVVVDPLANAKKRMNDNLRSVFE